MANLGIIHTALASSGLQGRFEAAALVAAIDIRNEAGNTANHAARLTWANAVIADADGYAAATARKLIRYGLGTNATFQGAGDNLDDSSIQFVVNSLLSDATILAGVS